MATWSELFALMSLRGEPYIAAREEVLASKGLRDRLTPLLGDASWETVIQAKILLGWHDQRRLYEGVLRDLDAENPAAAERTVSGLNLIWNRYAKRTKTELGEAILPLSWEAILRLSGDMPEWRVITFLRMIGAAPNALSVEPLIAYINAAPDHRLRHAGAAALGDLPKAMIASRGKQEQTRHREIASLLADVLD